MNYLKKVKKSDLELLISKNIDLSVYVDKYKTYLENPIVKFLAKAYWDDISSYLVKPHLILIELSKVRPDLAKILSTPKGRKWLNNNCEKILKKLYRYIWE